MFTVPGHLAIGCSRSRGSAGKWPAQIWTCECNCRHASQKSAFEAYSGALPAIFDVISEDFVDKSFTKRIRFFVMKDTMRLSEISLCGQFSKNKRVWSETIANDANLQTQ